MNARIWGELANTRINREDARRAAERGLRIFPAEFDCMKALVAAQAPDIERAMKRAIAHPVASPRARAFGHILLGGMRVRERDDAAAREHFRQAAIFARIIASLPATNERSREAAILPQPSPTENLLFLANAFLDSGDAASAVECFRLVRPEDAVAALRERQRLHPNDSRLVQLIAAIKPQQ